MQKRLFVANIPYTATEMDLESLFIENGFTPREVKIVLDRETGRSRGFGFVEMPTPEVASAAIVAMNEKVEMLGRFLTIREAEERNQQNRAPKTARSTRDW